jgi:hypothetical protein
MIKNKLVTPVLQMLFKVMSEVDEEDQDDEEDDHVESSKPSIVAAQTLNEMVIYKNIAFSFFIRFKTFIFTGFAFTARSSRYSFASLGGTGGQRYYISKRGSCSSANLNLLMQAATLVLNPRRI